MSNCPLYTVRLKAISQFSFFNFVSTSHSIKYPRSKVNVRNVRSFLNINNSILSGLQKHQQTFANSQIYSQFTKIFCECTKIFAIHKDILRIHKDICNSQRYFANSQRYSQFTKIFAILCDSALSGTKELSLL